MCLPHIDGKTVAAADWSGTIQYSTFHQQQLEFAAELSWAAAISSSMTLIGAENWEAAVSSASSVYSGAEATKTRRTGSTPLNKSAVARTHVFHHFSTNRSPRRYKLHAANFWKKGWETRIDFTSRTTQEVRFLVNSETVSKLIAINSSKGDGIADFVTQSIYFIGFSTII